MISIDKTFSNHIINTNTSLMEFIEEYGQDLSPLEAITFDLELKANSVCTSPFGLADGYRKDSKGKTVWDAIRLHTGEDTVAKNSKKIYAPIDFEKAEFNDYGPDHPYGSLLSLFSEKYNFEIRVCHIHPDNISKKLLKFIKSNKFITKEMFLGIEGNYGMSTGSHSHVELLSYNDTKSQLLEGLLQCLHFDGASNSYNVASVRQFYKTASYFENKSDSVIDADWEAQKKKRRIVSIVNDVKHDFTDWFAGYEIRTRYAISKVLGI